MIACTDNSIPSHLRAEWERLSSLDSVALDREQEECLAITSEALTRLAIILRIKEQRGLDVSGLKIGMVRQLRLIADGTLLADVVTTFADRPAVIKRVARLPLTDQAEIVKTKSPPSPEPILRINPEPVVIDKTLGLIMVTGYRVIITRDQLSDYLEQLGGVTRTFMCSGCGEGVGSERPKRCAKCGSSSFERESAPRRELVEA